MLKQIFMAACVAVLAAGCGATRNDTSSSSSGTTASSQGTSTSTGSNGTTVTSQGTSSSSSSTTQGSTGSSTTQGSTGSSSTGSTASTSSTTGSACTQMTIAQARTAPIYTQVCLTDATVILTTSPGAAKADGGTQYDGNYYVADTNGDAILVYKSHYENAIDNPTRGHTADINGLLKAFPTTDAGVAADATIELAGNSLAITDNGPGTLPTPKTVAFADLNHASPAATAVGSYVLIPAGTYTQDSAAAGLQNVIPRPDGGSSIYQDGFSLSDGTTTIWVDTYDMMKGASATAKSCMPTDGGMPDFSHGGFKGILDYGFAPGGDRGALLYFGDCADQP